MVTEQLKTLEESLVTVMNSTVAGCSVELGLLAEGEVVVFLMILQATALNCPHKHLCCARRFGSVCCLWLSAFNLFYYLFFLT